MEIIKVVVDGCEYEYITSLDNDEVEYKINIRNNNKEYDMFENTIKIKKISTNGIRENEDSEING